MLEYIGEAIEKNWVMGRDW